MIPTDPALALIAAVRQGDQMRVQRILRRPDLPRIAVALAERETGIRPLAPCGTRTAAERHLNNGEPLDDACLTARRRYYRDARRAQRAARARDKATPVVYTQPAPTDAATIRTWARETGFPVHPRGRLSAQVIAAYLNAQVIC